MSQLLPGVKLEELRPPSDPKEGLRVACKAASELKDAYGHRLREVVLSGSWARGKPDEESDVDLLVVLDTVTNREQETDRTVVVLYDLEADSARAIQAFRVAEHDVRGDVGTLVRVARPEGTTVHLSDEQCPSAGSSLQAGGRRFDPGWLHLGSVRNPADYHLGQRGLGGAQRERWIMSLASGLRRGWALQLGLIAGLRLLAAAVGVSPVDATTPNLSGFSRNSA